MDYLKKTVTNNYEIQNKLYINYSKLGLNNYFVMGEENYESPYLVMTCEFYDSNVFHLSRFCIPKNLEKNFLNKIEILSPNAKVFMAREITKPTYNYNPFKNDYDELGLWRFMDLYSNQRFPDLQPLDTNHFNFNKTMLNILHLMANKIPLNEAPEDMKMTKRIFYYNKRKMKGKIFENKLNIKAIDKILFILDNTEHNLEDPQGLVSAFTYSWIYTHAFEIKQVSRLNPTNLKEGLLCLLTPPTRNVPLVGSTLDKFYKLKFELYSIDEITELFNLNKVYNEKEQNWEWKDKFIKL
ncbi:MAG: hypothetical protein ACTSRG_22600 [Candidatus Helarchaeota archaeon]